MLRWTALAITAVLAVSASGCASVGQWDKGEEIVGANERFGVSMVAKDYQDFLSGMHGTRLSARNNGAASVCVNVNSGAWTYAPAGQEKLVSERWRTGGTFNVAPASACS